MTPTTDSCSVLVWYGAKANPQSIAASYEGIIRLMATVGRTPHWVSTSTAKSPGRPVPFAVGDRRLKSSGFSNISELSLISVFPELNASTQDFAVTATLSVKHSFVFIAAEPHLLRLSNPSTMTMARAIVDELHPQYGIAYIRERRLGPTLYAIGIGQGLALTGAEDAEARRIAAWGDAMDEKAWQDGMLRDVYSWNFLNRTQLNTSVSGESLEQWIAHDSRRGTLERFSSDLVLWRLDPEQINPVRVVLQRAKLLLGQ